MYLCLNFLFKIQTVNVHCEICRSFCNSLIFLSIPTLNDDISWPNSLNQGRTLRRTKWTKSYIWEKRGKILLRSFFLFIEKAATRSEGKKYSCGKKGTEFGSMIFVDAAAISSFVRHRVAEGLPIGAGDTDSALTPGAGTCTAPGLIRGETLMMMTPGWPQHRWGEEKSEN